MIAPNRQPARPANLFKLTATLCCTLLAALILAAQPTTAAAEVFISDTQKAALDRMNEYRAKVGVPLLRADPGLMRAASNHAKYYVLNFGHSSLQGMGLHNEIPGRPGFTGATMQDRIRGAGFTGRYNEGINLMGDPVAAIDSFMDMVNHRLPIIDPAYTDMGYGGNSEGRAKIDVFTYGGSGRGQSGPEFVGYPADGQTGVTTKYVGYETNAAFPGASYPLGTAITLKYTGPGDGALSRASIRAAGGGAELPVVSRSSYNYITRNVLVIAPRQPLAAATRYEVRIEGTKNGAWFVQSWSFTTR